MIDVKTKKQLVSLVTASCKTRLKMWTADYDECISQSAYLRGIQFSLWQIPEGRRIECDAWRLCQPIQQSEDEFDASPRLLDSDSAQAKKFVDECVLNAIHVYELRVMAYETSY